MSAQHVKPSSRSRSQSTARLTVWMNGEQLNELMLESTQVTTIGRHPVCTLPLNDTLCSRHHSEVFLSGDGWVIRDLGSRNGTFVNKERISGDYPLSDRSVIHIGNTVLLFSFQREDTVRGVDTVVLMDTYKDGPSASDSTQANIVEEAKSSRYQSEVMSDDRRADLSEGLGVLYRMALKSATAGTPQELAEIVLDSILDATHGDLAAVLIRDDDFEATQDESGLKQLAFRARAEGEFDGEASRSLTRRTLKENSAVLAHYVLSGNECAGLSRPSDSLVEMDACSVICAPLRRESETIGVLHVYSTMSSRELTDDDLHLTLAAADHLALALEGHSERDHLRERLAHEVSENKALRDQLAKDSLLVGESESIRCLREEAHRVAPTSATVLIRGESGVGKELVARTIHRSSKRAEQPFVCMNCAALTESLLESELFGHEKGSFTGATEQKIGKFEQADGGTLFLDEVGEMSLNIQAKFLRVLEGHPFERVGGNKPISVDVRVVAATNRDLEEAVKEGQFRQDLYFRLHVMQLMIDPLRDRRKDVLILANHFLDRFSSKLGVPTKRLSRNAIDRLYNYRWPGNVRELQNAIERAVILSHGDEIAANDICFSTLEDSDDSTHFYNRTAQGRYREMPLERLEFEHIMATLEHTGWNKTRAAKILGIERSTLDRKLNRAGIQRPGDASC